jgi:hypothetical protein
MLIVSNPIIVRCFPYLSRRKPKCLSLESHQELQIEWNAQRHVPLSKYTKLIRASKGSTESNDAVHISLVTPSIGGPRTLYSFNPAMTYSVFGDDERIFGYQGLKVNLRYNACDMRPGLQIQYTKKFKQVGETGPTDLKAVLEPYLPKSMESLPTDGYIR